MDDTTEQIQCLDHPFQSSNPGAICPFCLKEKLRKLLSSSSPFPPPPPPLSPSSPTTTNNKTLTNPNPLQTSKAPRPKFPFLTTSSSSKTLKKHTTAGAVAPATSAVLKKSKSMAVANSPRKKSFWSFLHPSSSSEPPNLNAGESTEELPSSSSASKVGRSRSVGCGSRSFSGDFLERISTGFGDCTLRRVESQRESKSKNVNRINSADGEEQSKQHHMHHPRCSGLFSTVSSTHCRWVAEGIEGKPKGGKGRSWGWALASPMRAFRPVNSVKHVSNGGDLVDNSSRVPA